MQLDITLKSTYLPTYTVLNMVFDVNIFNSTTEYSQATRSESTELAESPSNDLFLVSRTFKFSINIQSARENFVKLSEK